MYVVLIYDVCLSDEKGLRKADARILRKVFKECKKYLVHVQKSVFEGELSEAQLLSLKNKLKTYLRYEKDSCIIFTARNNNWMRKEYLTKEFDQTSAFI